MQLPVFYYLFKQTDRASSCQLSVSSRVLGVARGCSHRVRARVVFAIKHMVLQQRDTVLGSHPQSFMMQLPYVLSCIQIDRQNLMIHLPCGSSSIGGRKVGSHRVSVYCVFYCLLCAPMKIPEAHFSAFPFQARMLP